MEEGPCHCPPCYLVQSFSCWGGSRNEQYTRWCHTVWRCKFSALTTTGKLVAGPPSVNLPVLWFEQLTEQMSSQLTFLKHSPTKFASKHFVILTTTKKLTLECMLFYDFVLDCGYPPTCQCTHLVREGTLFILQAHHASICDRLIPQGRTMSTPIPLPILSLAPGRCRSYSSKGHLHHRALMIELNTCKI